MDSGLLWLRATASISSWPAILISSAGWGMPVLVGPSDPQETAKATIMAKKGRIVDDFNRDCP